MLLYNRIIHLIHWQGGMLLSSVVKNFIITFFVSLIIFGLLAYGIIHGVGSFFAGDKNPIQSGDDTESSVDEETNDPDNPFQTLETIIDEEGNVVVMNPNPIVDDSFSILLVGTDYQPDVHKDYDLSEYNAGVIGFGVKERTVNADSILLVRVDRETKRFTFITLPSNIRIALGGSQTTLGSVYDAKGIEFLRDKVYGLTGINPDYYLAVGLDNMAAIIDELGGIPFTVPVDMLYEDSSQDLTIKLKRGTTTLDGSAAMQMLRYVSYADGDISRQSLIVDFAQALLKQFTAASYLDRAAVLYVTLFSKLETNFTVDSLTKHLEILFDYPEFTVEELTYPGEKIYEDGKVYLNPNLTQAINLFNAYR